MRGVITKAPRLCDGVASQGGFHILKTEIIKLDPRFPDFEAIGRGARLVRQGGLVIFPTETVYGIAANADHARALERLRDVKRRSEGKPFTVMMAKKDDLLKLTPCRNSALFKLIDSYWPGPLTVIVPDRIKGKTLGFRIPNHRVALALIREAGCSVAAPSANVSEKVPPKTCGEALQDLDGLVDMAFDNGPTQYGQASTVVDLTKDNATVVRAGAIPADHISRVAQRKTVLFICTGNSCRSVLAEYLLKDMLKGRDDVEVFSAGTGVLLHSSPTQETLGVLKAQGIDATDHRSLSLNPIMLHKSDLILAMTRAHRQQILDMAPEVESRTYLLREFDDQERHDLDLDIPDPIGQSLATYTDCAGIIARSLHKVMKLI